MQKSLLIVPILTLWLTGCSHLGTIETGKDIAAACPDVKTYSQKKQCEARAEAKRLAAAGADYPVLQEMLVDGKVMRDQARVCRGEDIPKGKKLVCK